MKQYIALLACVFALTACGNQSDSDDGSTEAQASGGSDTSAQAEGSDTSAKADEGNSGGEFDSPEARRSYALGMDIGNSLKELPVEIQTDALTEGVTDVVSDGETRLSQEELDDVMQSFVKEMETKQKKKAGEQAQANLDKGKKFLAENKDKDGVKTTDSGLQYKVVEEGEGQSPGESDSVTVHYTGKLIDGTVFDSSRKRGEPVTFPVDAVIPGWTEALQLMKKGAKYELYIPADLAYGERGAGAQIGPNETLVFNVELLGVNESEGDESASSADDTAAADSQSDSGQDAESGDSASE